MAVGNYYTGTRKGGTMVSPTHMHLLLCPVNCNQNRVS